MLLAVIVVRNTVYFFVKLYGSSFHFKLFLIILFLENEKSKKKKRESFAVIWFILLFWKCKSSKFLWNCRLCWQGTGITTICVSLFVCIFSARFTDSNDICIFEHVKQSKECACRLGSPLRITSNKNHFPSLCFWQ